MKYTTACMLGEHAWCKNEECDCWCHVKRGIEAPDVVARLIDVPGFLDYLKESEDKPKQ